MLGISFDGAISSSELAAGLVLYHDCDVPWLETGGETRKIDECSLSQLDCVFAHVSFKLTV